MSIEADLQAVKVHIVGSDAKLIPDKIQVTRPKVRTVASQVITSATSTTNQSYHILPLAPNRCRATITVVGQSSDIVYLCMSKSDAQVLNGAPLMGLQVITIEGGNDLHIGAAPGVSVIIGIIADYVSD